MLGRYPVSIQNIEFYLSGGAANADPLLSLGGAISSTKLLSQSVVKTSVNITGVSVVDAAGNFNGEGVLSFKLNPARLAWVKPNGIQPSSFLHETIISNDGRYIIPCREGDASIIVDVIANSLPALAQQDTVNVSSILSNLFGAIGEAQAQSGLTQYRCLYVKNISASPITLEYWIAADMVAADGLEIGFSVFVDGTTEETIADELTAPLVPTFTKNFTAQAQQLTIAAGQSIGFWLKLKTPVLSEGDTPVDFGSITFNEV